MNEKQKSDSDKTETFNSNDTKFMMARVSAYVCAAYGMVRYLFGFECLNMELIQQLWQEIYISRKSKMMSRLHQNVYMFMFTRIFVCLYRRNGTYKTGKKKNERDLVGVFVFISFVMLEIALRTMIPRHTMTK